LKGGQDEGYKKRAMIFWTFIYPSAFIFNVMQNQPGTSLKRATLGLLVLIAYSRADSVNSETRRGRLILSPATYICVPGSPTPTACVKDRKYVCRFAHRKVDRHPAAESSKSAADPIRKGRKLFDDRQQDRRRAGAGIVSHGFNGPADGAQHSGSEMIVNITPALRSASQSKKTTC